MVANNTKEVPPASGKESSTKASNKPSTEKDPKPEDKVKKLKDSGQHQDGKPSNAELKKKAKEEKAARRAKEKQGTAALGQENNHDVSSSKEKKLLDGGPLDHKMSAQVQKHKRAGSVSTDKKQLPVRSVDQHAAPTSTAVMKDSKRVAFFSHLYGVPRRTSIAGAGKDVHPAVISLGVQMSNYVVCGSNARCVAMLLAFKKVSIIC